MSYFKSNLFSDILFKLACMAINIVINQRPMGGEQEYSPINCRVKRGLFILEIKFLSRVNDKNLISFLTASGRRVFN